MAAEGAATLTGLIFVAVSINLARILEFSGLPERAAETIAQLMGVLIVALVALVPGQSAMLLGIELAVVGVVLWLFQTWLQYLSLRGGDRKRPVISIVIAQVAAFPFIVAGISLAIGAIGGLYWLVPGMILMMAVAVSNAWVLLVEILR